MTKNSIHAHMNTTTTDCDGRIDNGYVATLNTHERAARDNAKGGNDFHELDFKARILSGAVSFHAEDAKVTVNPDGFEYIENTEEGYRHVEARWCTEDCSLVQWRTRDHFAEAAGY